MMGLEFMKATSFVCASECAHLEDTKTFLPKSMSSKEWHVTQATGVDYLGNANRCTVRSLGIHPCKDFCWSVDVHIQKHTGYSIKFLSTDQSLSADIIGHVF